MHYSMERLFPILSCLMLRTDILARKPVTFTMSSRNTTAQEQVRRRASWPGPLLILLLAALITFVVLVRSKRIPYNQREINKRYVNPLMLKFAGSRYFPQAVVYHTGRKSGNTYATPITVQPVSAGFIVALPYGANVDWCRNILAAGHCSLQWHGSTYDIVKAELIDADTAIAELPPMQQNVFRLLNVEYALKLYNSTAVPAQESSTVV